MASKKTEFFESNLNPEMILDYNQKIRFFWFAFKMALTIFFYPIGAHNGVNYWSQMAIFRKFIEEVN